MEQIEKWAQKLEKIMNEIPRQCWLFAADGTLHVMVTKDGKRIHTPYGGVDQDYVVYSITSRATVDGGDW